MELFVQLSCQERGQRVALVVRVTGPPSLGLAVLLTAHMSLKPAQHCAFLVLFFLFFTKYNLTIKKQTLKSSEVARRINSLDK